MPDILSVHSASQPDKVALIQGDRVLTYAAYNERANRVGSAFHNRDGSMNIYLDALPRDGKIQIREDDREREPKKDRGALAEEAVEA